MARQVNKSSTTRLGPSLKPRSNKFPNESLFPKVSTHWRLQTQISSSTDIHLVPAKAKALRFGPCGKVSSPVRRRSSNHTSRLETTSTFLRREMSSTPLSTAIHGQTPPPRIGQAPSRQRPQRAKRSVSSRQNGLSLRLILPSRRRLLTAGHLVPIGSTAGLDSMVTSIRHRSSSKREPPRL